uniref:Uncharacterized protein n=1 Tax=Anguilla anguilla TaxID=7936 RepID=A0A0E9QRP3_ANGAN
MINPTLSFIVHNLSSVMQFVPLLRLNN